MLSALHDGVPDGELPDQARMHKPVIVIAKEKTFLLLLHVCVCVFPLELWGSFCLMVYLRFTQPPKPTIPMPVSLSHAKIPIFPMMQTPMSSAL